MPALVQKALELEERSGQVDKAIIRIDKQILSAQAKDECYLRKAQLLMRHNRKVEAIAVAKLGLEFNKSLPQAVQNLPAVRKIREELGKICCEG